MFAGHGKGHASDPAGATPGGPARVPNYGFVIDNRKCIGCHACSVACKAENDVPLGVNRTWVKSVEVGRYPDVRRHFQVTRCNHCANPPCVRICPTAAMYQRADGIVEFDGDACIGCKACLQACPYDAIYIDPESRTAAKCHYCAHRTEVGLEPACVVVCPEHAIISGDLGDPSSEIARLVATQPVTVRKPEQGTAPKLFYIDGHDVAMHPTATERAPASFAFADVIPLHGGDAGEASVERHDAEATRDVDAPRGGHGSREGRGRGHRDAPRPLPWPQAQGLPNAGPIHVGGQVAGQMVQQVAYNAQHKVPWHWPVPAYLVTKAVAAGSAMLAVVVAALRGDATASALAMLGVTALAFTAITALLLVADLERPERFHYILLRPQWRSWLTRGAFVLLAFGVVTAAWTAIALGTALRWPPAAALEGWLVPLIVLDLPLAVVTAAYTGYLFAQAEGRDLWQSPLLPAQLVVRAVMAGAAFALTAQLALGLFDGPGGPSLAQVGVAMWALVALGVALPVHLGLVLAAEAIVPVASETARVAAAAIHEGRYRHLHWTGGIWLGHILPLALAFSWPWIVQGGGRIGIGALQTWPLVAISTAVLAGLYALEHAFVMAPQEVPNS